MYSAPGTLTEAVEALGAGELRILAGGTDLYPAAAGGSLSGPLLDVTGIAGLTDVTVAPDGERVRIGAAVSWRRIALGPLPAAFDALRTAARQVGSVQIQSRGTIGGNLCHSSPAADGVPPLLALEAEVELTSRRGVRRLALPDFLIGPRRTARRPDEILTAIEVTPPRGPTVSVFLKLGTRQSLVISYAMVAVVLVGDGKGRIAEARIAVGACSPVAVRLRSLEAELIGAWRSGIAGRVRPEHLEPLSPIGDVRATAAYRSRAARALVERALVDASTGPAP